MHILFLHQYFCPPGGSGNNRSFEIARDWVRAGHTVTMLTSVAYFPESMRFSGKSKEFTFEGIRVIALNVPYSHMMGAFARVRAFLRFFRAGLRCAKHLSKPDVIYASSTPPTVGEMGLRLSKRWGIPFLYETVDVWPDVPIGMGIIRNRALVRWLHKRVNRIYDAASLVVALSDGMKMQILSHGISPEKVIVSYNGTNLQAFPFVERPLRAGLHVIYTGTVGKANGVSVLVHLSRCLAARNVQGVRFTVLGAGNDLALVKREAHDHGADNLHFVEMVAKERVAAFLSEADAGIVTFAPHQVLEANSANKFYDYLASGLPVLINYAGWQADYLREWKCGFSSPMGDIEMLADNVERLLKDSHLRKEMAANGRRLAETYFDRSKIAASLLRHLQAVVDAHASAHSHG